MPREREGYREVLADILEFSGGARLLTMEQVKRYTGLKDNRTVRHAFPAVNGHYVSAMAMARAMVGGESK